MPITILGTVVHQQKSGTDAEIIALSGVEHGQLYLSNDSNKIWIGNRDGSLKLITNDYNDLINKPNLTNLPTTTQISNWNTAFGWGDHSSKYVSYITNQSLSREQRTQALKNVRFFAEEDSTPTLDLDVEERPLIFQYANATNWVNKPHNGYWMMQTLMRGASNAAGVQIGYEVSANATPVPNMYLRLKNNTGWGSWVKMMTQADIPAAHWEFVDGALRPLNDIYAIQTRSGLSNSLGFVKLTPGTTSNSGFFSVHRPDQQRVGYIGFFTDNMVYDANIGNHVFKTGSVVIENILTDNALAEVLVPTSTGIIKKRTIASLGIPTQLWTESSNRIQPLNSDRISTRTGSKGYVEIFSNGSSNSGTIALYTATDTNVFSIHSADGVDTTINSPNSTNYDVGVGKSHNFTGAVKLNTLDTSTTTSYLTEDNGVIKKRSLHVATNSVVGGVRIATGGGLSVDSSGFLSIASWNDYLYATLSSDATKSTPGFSDLLTISLPSAGVWEVKLIGGYSVTSTSNVLGVNFSCTGAVNYMIGSAQAGLTNNPANSETTKVLTASSSGMNINGITVANDTLYVNASYIINVNEPCDIKFQYASPAGGNVTVKQGTSFIAKKLNNYAP